MREHFGMEENTKCFHTAGRKINQTKKAPNEKFSALVEATGFEPAAPWSQTRCATKLRHASKQNYTIIYVFWFFVNSF